jgi:hypothetical protein
MLRLGGQDSDGNNGAKGRHGQEGDKTSRLEGREVGGFEGRESEDQETHLMKSEQLPSTLPKTNVRQASASRKF